MKVDKINFKKNMQAIRFSHLLYRTKPVHISSKPNYFSKYCPVNEKCKIFGSYRPKVHFNHLSSTNCPVSLNITFSPIHFAKTRYLSTQHEKKDKTDAQEIEEPTEKLSLYKRYKKMFKEYWYVLLPVHCATSVVWFGSFYYASTCGLDIIPFLEYINLPETLISPLRNSSLGHIAVASALYKLATPARYMVTLGGSTFAVNNLKKRGLIRPVPTKAEFKQIIQNKLKKDVSEKDN